MVVNHFSSILNATSMRAVVYEGIPFQMTVQDVPVPSILNDTDAIVRITTSALCGSDLHVYHGVSGAGTPPWVMGHEAIGYVAQVGSAVASLSVGDYVIIADTPSTGHLAMEPVASSFYGVGNGLDGLQAEYARVPFADLSLVPLPITSNTTTRALEQDYLTVGDIFSTAWAALGFAGFEPGDTVAVFGAGPVGLLTVYSAFLRGASRVYCIDHVAMRLERAASIGAVPINFAETDPVAQILASEPSGVMRSIDCVGIEAVNADLEPDEGIIVRQMINLTHFGGGIGQVGVWRAQDASAAAPLGSTLSPNLTFPLSSIFSKQLSWKSGPVDPKPISSYLVDLIHSGKAQPNFIASAEISIEEVPEYYQRFNDHEEIKVYIHFP
ncbi:hypothetical protein E8E14_008703 [Neopestalotiopsis sp. 37M]|nr:hypothetical protein E8E14_008703 [Neopestalotiopsis sp. 37M]